MQNYEKNAIKILQNSSNSNLLYRSELWWVKKKDDSVCKNKKFLISQGCIRIDGD
jgi:hypothetical protein